MGRSGVRFDPDKVDIAFNGVALVQGGIAVGGDAMEQAGQVLREKQIVVAINLHDGQVSEDSHTCDLSLDYVKINADYRS
jgi:glutamate N-acetyltransferase/amino-acid N-acetyltransferase